MTERRGTAWLIAAAVVLLVAGLAALWWLRSGSDAPRAEESFDQQLDRIATVVEQVRALRFDDVPDPVLLAPDALADRVAEELSAYGEEEADADARILEALGAVPAGTDLRTLLREAYEVQVAGFYDPETGELVVGARPDGARLSRSEELILAHELQHALADQALGLPVDPEVPDEGEDEALAAQALVEGDATVTMEAYAEAGFTVVDRLLLPGELAAAAEQLAAAQGLPYYVQRMLLFPYQEGAAFVGALRAAGGWAAVDAAYDRPPSSTAEVLFPERYPAPPPPQLPPPADLGAPWTRSRTADLGAADLLVLFEAPGGQRASALEDPRGAAALWEAGRVVLQTDGPRSAVEATVRGGEGMCAAVRAWYDRAHADDTMVRPDTWAGDAWDAALACTDGVVRLGIAGDLATARSLVGVPVEGASAPSGSVRPLTGAVRDTR